MMFWAVGLAACGSGLYAAYHYAGATEVEMPTARVRKGDFIISVRTRGDIKSSKSVVLMAPQAPGLRIMHMARNGQTVSKGDVLVEFDPATQEQNVLTRQNLVEQIQGQIDQTNASQKMSDEQDAMTKMTSEYNLEQSKLDASKAAVIALIDGQKNRIQVGVSEGRLQMVKANINAHEVGQEATLVQLQQRMDNAKKLLKQAQDYLGVMQLKAPVDGVVNILTNFRSQGTFGRGGAPPFKEGDNVWTGAQILEIPDLESMYINLALDEVDRGKIALGQQINIRVDSIPDKQFTAKLDFINPAAQLVFNGVGANMQANTQKVFPAKGTLQTTDDRLRPNTSATAEIIIERTPNSLLIPIRASFEQGGKPTVFVQNGTAFVRRSIEIGKRNDDDLVVTRGLKEGEVVALEDPVAVAKKARKKI